MGHGIAQMVEGDQHRSEPQSDGLVYATWSRSFLGVTILAFRDHSYLIYIGAGSTARLPCHKLTIEDESGRK